MVAPDWWGAARGRFRFYRADTVRYAMQRFWIKHRGRDDSRGLRVRGRGESATEARSRWREGLDIPVLNPGELKDFLARYLGNAIRAIERATASGKQYELVLRNRLDFDDWRRGQ